MASFGGIDINQASTVYAGGRAVLNLFKLGSGKKAPNPQVSKGPYRPANWSDGGGSADSLFMIRPSISFKSGRDASKWEPLFFDANILEHHHSQLRVTEYPIQTGANINDHAFIMSEKLMLSILVSDVMDRVDSRDFSDYRTKSISAFQALKDFQKSREILRITTRLNTYYNMILEDLDTPDDYTSSLGLRCTASFRQLIVAEIDEQPVSDSPTVTSEIKVGAVQAKAPAADQGGVLGSITDNFKSMAKDLGKDLDGFVSASGDAVNTIKETMKPMLDSFDDTIDDLKDSLNEFAKQFASGDVEDVDIEDPVEETTIKDPLTNETKTTTSINEKAIANNADIEQITNQMPDIKEQLDKDIAQAGKEAQEKLTTAQAQASPAIKSLNGSLAKMPGLLKDAGSMSKGLDTKLFNFLG